MADTWIEDADYEEMSDNYYSHVEETLIDDPPYYDAPWGTDDA